MKARSYQVLSIAFAALIVVLTGGCQSKHSVPPKSSVSQQGITYTYHLRGIVKALPQPNQLPQSVAIKVGPIAHWVGLSGKVEPMMAMTMPYQLAHHVTLNDITTGSKVAFIYKVNWTADRMVVTRIKRLPDNTVINFSMPADSPAPSPNEKK